MYTGTTQKNGTSFLSMNIGDRPMETTGFSSFLKVIVATAGVLLDAAGISKFLLNTFA